MDTMVINSVNSALISNTMIFIGYLVAVSIQIYEGLRNKLPYFKWVVLVATVNVFFLLGCKFFSFSKADWMYMLESMHLMPTSEKTALGGLLLGGVILFSLVRLFNLSAKAFDAFAISVPISMAIQKIGCLYGGCCFGGTTKWVLGIRYGRGTPAYYQHLRDDIIQFGDLTSAQVHAVQVYELLALGLLAFVLFFLRKRIKRYGNLLILTIIMVSLIKGATGLFRDAHATAISIPRIYGFNGILFILILMSILFSVLLFIRSRNVIDTRKEISSLIRKPQFQSLQQLSIKRLFAGLKPEMVRPVIVLIIVIALLIYFRDWLNFDEYIIALILLAPVFISFCIVLINRMKEQRNFIKLMAVFILLIVLMGQSIPEKNKDSLNIKYYHSIKLNKGHGNVEKRAYYRAYREPSGCQEGQTITRIENFKQDYSFYGGGYGFTKINEIDNIKTNFYLNAAYGSVVETRLSDGLTSQDNYYFVNPVVQTDFRSFGLTVGMNFGTLPVPIGKETSTDRPISAIKKASVLPSIGLRFGKENILFLKYSYYNNFPSSFPAFKNRLEIGSGFGTSKGFTFQVGTNFHDPYLTTYIPIKDRVVLESMYLWDGRLKEGQLGHLSLGLHYRFGHYEISSDPEKP